MEENRPIDGFTEQNIESLYSEMKNNTTKSIILAPFNSTMTEESQHTFELNTRLVDDKSQIKFSRRCRETNRQYEFNNNGQLDNGVYHKQKIQQNSFEKGEKSFESTQGIQVSQKWTVSKPQLALQSADDEDSMGVIYETFQKAN